MNATASTRNAIIVGASSGLGEALAYELARHGWRLGLTGRRTERLAEVAQRCGPGHFVRAMDVQEPEAAMRGFDELAREMGGCDLCIVSSGIARGGEILEWENEMESLAVNAVGFTALCVAAFNLFVRQRRGHLAGISSVAAMRGGWRAPSYHATKAYEGVYLEGLRYRAAVLGLPIRVTAIHPGFVHTEMTAGMRGMVFVSSAEKAARQIRQGLERGRARIFVTRRWGPIALLLHLLPDRLAIAGMRLRRRGNASL